MDQLKENILLDRIIPKKGYIQGNLVIVSDIVNLVKSDTSLEDMEKILIFYTKKIIKSIIYKVKLK